jgi:membrane protein DedA with SNARE-associated domain
MIEMIVNWTVAVLGKTGYWGVAILMALENACIPIPSEAILPFGGYLASSANPHNRLSLFWVIFWGTIGGNIGSLFAYYIGALGGRPLIDKYAKKLRISKSHLHMSNKLFQDYGEKIVFFSRLMPIVRTFISLPAGISKMDVKKFTIYTFFGSLIWSILLSYAGYILGNNWMLIRSWLHIADYAVIIMGVSAIIYFVLQRKKKSKLENDDTI